MAVVRVSMPFIGRIPFLRLRQAHGHSAPFECVNALHRANPISTVKVYDEKGELTCVNALHRANPISTALFWKPHKQGVSEVDSAGNSQNILKNRIFRDGFSFRTI